MHFRQPIVLPRSPYNAQMQCHRTRTKVEHKLIQVMPAITDIRWCYARTELKRKLMISYCNYM